ncbi:unnamed protein product [Adineta steineri]|uniref:Uncharacterized protein n=1 Tax=Adineta steineri TaxID=433720 RepID=A0A815RBM0_9BILA|nr:unnamed protein product [Adineta steineri]CAF3606714.1 unnamed protein product [Adineta steineri]
MIHYDFSFVSSSGFCYATDDFSDLLIDIDPILDELDNVIASNSIPSPDLLRLCLTALSSGSVILPDEIKAKLNAHQYDTYVAQLRLHRLKSNEISRKLKQLPLKPKNSERGLLRDMFHVTSRERKAAYFVTATEYYSEVQIHKNSDDIMKLCEWKVYRSVSPLNYPSFEDLQKMELVAYYYLAKSQAKDDTPTYVFGRTDTEDEEHVFLVDYGEKPGPDIDGYYQMKLLVIKDLQSLKGLPILGRFIHDRETGIATGIVSGFTRRIQDHLGIEADNDVLYDDDIVMQFDTKTKQKEDNLDL